MLLYYRKDLLEKYNIAPPKTYDELATAALKIMAEEKNPSLQGFGFQAKAIEGATCTALLPYWSQGAEIITNGKVTLDKAKYKAGLDMWQSLVERQVSPKNVTEAATEDTRKSFQAGNLIFAISWGYAWDHFQNDEGTLVKGRVGVVPLPAMAGGKQASCMGGWQWVVSAYSTKKAEAANLIRWLSSVEISKKLAIRASNFPVFASVYQDKDVLAAVPWFAYALPVVESASSRPVTPYYNEVSEIIRNNFNAFMAGVKTAEDSIVEINSRLKRALK